MTRGLTRDQIGVTEEMVLTYGERIWELSTNIQIRRGDPIRLMNWDQIEADRQGLGMADIEIADEIGLTRDQVLYIRLLLETRRFRRDHYHRLYELGGGRRFRAERFVPHEHRFAFRDEAMELRRSLDFDPRRASSYLRLGYWNADTVSRWLDRCARETPDRPALLTQDRTIDYRQVRDLALRLGNALLGLGVRRGDVVAVQLPNSIEFVVSYLATCMIGAVFCPLHVNYRRDRLQAMLETVAARTIICDEATAAHDAPTTMLNVARQVRSIENIIVAGGDAPETTLSFWETIDEYEPVTIETVPVASDPAIICFTSGTSAPARAVVHNYHTMLSNCRIVAPLYELGSDDGILNALPWSHAVGLTTLNLAILAGSAVVLPSSPDAADIAAAARAQKPTALFLGPDQLAAAQDGKHVDRGDYSSVRRATIWGQNCLANLLAQFDDKLPNGSVAQMWGATECLIVFHTPFDAPAEVRCGTLGTTVGSFAARMVSPSGEILPSGEEGEIEVLGCSVFAGYPGDKAATRALFSPDGWFRTGDLAVMDDDGNLRIAGRADDVIRRQGNLVNAFEVQSLLETHPSIAEATVLSMVDQEAGETACLFIRPAVGQGPDLRDIHRFLRENGVPETKWPDRIETVAEMPLTPTGKIMKHELAHLLNG